MAEAANAKKTEDETMISWDETCKKVRMDVSFKITASDMMITCPLVEWRSKKREPTKLIPKKSIKYTRVKRPSGPAVKISMRSP